jgi:hypothetical protein
MLRDKEFNKRGQIGIYVIIALVIVAGILIVAYYNGNLSVTGISSEFRPAYDLYISCIEQQVQKGIRIAGSQGGHIYLDSIEAPSSYAPYSSQLQFLGYNVPYWYYISGNGLSKENVPSISQMQSEIGRYVDENIGNCDFSSLDEQGYDLSLEVSKTKVVISDSGVDAEVAQLITIRKGEAKALQNDHKISVKSSLGSLYNTAKEVYDKEMSSNFMENYAEDVLRSYAPVDGVEFSCAPKTWSTQEVYNKLQDGLVGNFGEIKISGDYYSLKDKKSEYFVVPLDNKFSGTSASFVYSRDFPSKIEIYGGGVSQTTMMAQPIGNQAGIGMLGFCYVPYHFVYDLGFPVVIQLMNQDELFQFPMVVVIDKNKPKLAEQGNTGFQGDFDLCADSGKQIRVKFYDVNLNPISIDGSISYNCFDQSCNLGEVKGNEFNGKVPACVNGNLVVQAKGYGEKSQILSSNEETNADIILDKEYPVDVRLLLDGKEHSGNAVVIFEGENSVSAILPEQRNIKLTEGLYNISIYAYSNVSITIPASTKNLCSEVPRAGLFGILGGTENQCTTISMPETKIESGLVGGGKSQEYLFPDDLKKGNITLIGEALPKPNSLETLQYNFEAFDKMNLGVDFR